MLAYIRISITAIWVALSCFIGIIIGLLRPFDPRNVKIICNLLSLSRHILGIEFELRNKDLLEKSRPCVFISNHQDNMDIFPGSFSVPKYTVTIGKKSILYIPFFGLFYWLSGNILIDRSNKKKAFETMDIAANAIKNKKISVWIMPEGTRSRGRGVLPFKKGPFLTAIKAQVPIVPVAFSSYTSMIDLNKWKAGKIIIDVRPPISTAGLTLSDVNEIKDQAFHVIAHAVSLLDQELKVE
jgi:1-acyl-sn-glycerol-3-phosphate acyltransferase